MENSSPFLYFKTPPEVIRPAVMLCDRFPLSLWNVEEPLQESGIDLSHETIRFWWNRFGPMYAADIRKKTDYSGESIIELAVEPGRSVRKG